jgi:hypothetical protein
VPPLDRRESTEINRQHAVQKAAAPRPVTVVVLGTGPNRLKGALLGAIPQPLAVLELHEIVKL